MPFSWSDAEREWTQFLHEVDACRFRRKCSVSNAWFRGQEDAAWPLLPKLFRKPDRLDADRHKLVSALQQELSTIHANRILSRKKSQSLERLAEEARLRKDNAAQREFQARASVASQHESNYRKAADDVSRRVSVLEAQRYGERDAFINFCYRSNSSPQSSWETLANMQHHRIGTRLLDWTEVLAIAVFFATLKYRRALDGAWRDLLMGMSSGETGDQCLEQAMKLPPACVWVLNPYHLSRWSTGYNSLWSPRADERGDYFRSFFVDLNWPYKHPVPMLSPWTEPRIASQQAMFTVQGLCGDPLEAQVPDSEVAQCVKLMPAAAIWAARHLVTFVGTNTFTLFRDLDSLGDHINRHFLTP